MHKLAGTDFFRMAPPSYDISYMYDEASLAC